MSVEELKQEAIKKISAINDETAIKEILDHLQKLSQGEAYILSGHYDSIKQKYQSVLQKLAR